MLQINPAVIDFMVAKNGQDYNFRKAAEECAELTTVLLQLTNKKIDGAPEQQELIDEIGDVIIRLEILKRMVPEDLLQARLDKKLAKYEGYISENTYSKF
jgi:NTP pyrophosphatase (non-canonical NTP hydrolase)